MPMDHDAPIPPDAREHPATLTAILDRVADVFQIVTDVGRGDYSARLPADLPADHPLHALYGGVNEMITALAAQEQRNHEYFREIEDKLTTIEQQRAAIRELSAPIMEVWEGILCLPVVGVMDSNRSADMTDALLRAVVSSRARATIIDITGIEAMDTSTADHFIRMAKAVQLLGADCVLTGINPQIAQTIVHMGVEMQGLVTHRSLRDALQFFVGQGRSVRAR
jgi:rsbT co-antagonist protein RsbR